MKIYLTAVQTALMQPSKRETQENGNQVTSGLTTQKATTAPVQIGAVSRLGYLQVYVKKYCVAAIGAVVATVTVRMRWKVVPLPVSLIADVNVV